MTNHSAAVSTISWLLLAVVAIGNAQAGLAPGDCADLGAIPETPAVDFSIQVRPIFDSCTGCHGEGGPAGLDLRQDVAYGNLVGVESTTRPGQLRVEPFDPDRSVLMIAVNCSSPNGPAFQMPGTDESERALIRDWIAQGATAVPASRPVPLWTTAGLLVLVTLMLATGEWRLRTGSGRSR